MVLEDKKVLVVGSGVSGIGAAALLEEIHAIPVIYEGNTAVTEEEIRQKLGLERKIEIIIGELTPEVEAGIELVVLSPGVPIDLPMLESFKKRGIPLWGEIELAYVNAKGKVLAITGTNGKTTTTTLLGEIMKHHQREVYVVGNIGAPYTKIARETTQESVTVAEISSFQLETVHSFHPKVSAILNITPDHLDRHHTMEEYIRVKEEITRNQTMDDTCILNYEDEILRKFGENLETEVLFFSSQRKLNIGIYIESGTMWYSDGEETKKIVDLEQLKLLGVHNYENVMAAVGMALKAEVPLEEIKVVITAFKGVEHRIEFVAEKHGVTYYNDSKGTNPDAAIKGIQAMNRPTFLIAGGYDKQADYTQWIQSFDGKVRCLVLIGATSKNIEKAAKECGFYDIILADTLEEAVSICARKASEEDAVLLSPACASWGMFKNYEVRGEMFKKYVNSL
jgi:UDP-N-acetylmuramoylalanine--D-glutamate ligase